MSDITCPEGPGGTPGTDIKINTLGRSYYALITLHRQNVKRSKV